jgi:hypothetical protein
VGSRAARDAVRLNGPGLIQQPYRQPRITGPAAALRLLEDRSGLPPRRDGQPQGHAKLTRHGQHNYFA